MKNCVITFRSVTPAQRSEELLHRVGVECTMQRTPRWMEERGCGYSLRLDCQNAMAATMLLRQNGISYGKVYSLGDNGTSEEIKV